MEVVPDCLLVLILVLKQYECEQYETLNSLFLLLYFLVLVIEY